MAPADEKAELRREMAARLARLDGSRRAAAGIEVGRLLLQTHPPEAVGLVLGFYPLASEPDARPALRLYRENGALVALPRCEGKDLVFHAIDDLETDTAAGSLGIREPAADSAPADLSDRGAGPPRGVLLLVPGRAFDVEGNRCGRGGGHYDRFIAEIRRNFARSARSDSLHVVGLCFACQVMEKVPTDAFDQRMDQVLWA